jgi:NitT/TauT family transport system substrate-binding protein
MSRFTPRAIAAALALSFAATALPVTAQAEGSIRIAEQFGIIYMLLNVAQDQQLIEKQGKKNGVDIKVERVQLSGGSAVNDALLSGAIDIAGAGIGPLLTIWDRTSTAARTSKAWRRWAASRTTWSAPIRR